ncbi:hypothetical protein [Halovenus halobia]|uniref:hypothetical protein n=1 Tax=Halovenus halobia TaxID=3396622 RepID=UPI003F54B49E
MVVDQLAILGFAALLGGLMLSYGRRRYNRAESLSRLVADGGEPTAAGERTISGPVEVDRPAEPQRRPPDHHNPEEPGGDPGIWAWRVQREQATDSRHWETLDGGIAVGDIAVRDDWDRVQIDAESLRCDSVEDPFDADHLFLGDPDIDVYVEERDGVLADVSGDCGPVKDVEVSVNIGNETTTPDRYQATAIREGEELRADGTIADGGEQPAVRGDVAVGIGDLSTRADQLYSTARRWGAGGAIVLVLGVSAAAGTVIL